MMRLPGQIRQEIRTISSSNLSYYQNKAINRKAKFFCGRVLHEKNWNQTSQELFWTELFTSLSGITERLGLKSRDKTRKTLCLGWTRPLIVLEFHKNKTITKNTFLCKKLRNFYRDNNSSVSEEKCLPWSIHCVVLLIAILCSSI